MRIINLPHHQLVVSLANTPPCCTSFMRSSHRGELYTVTTRVTTHSIGYPRQSPLSIREVEYTSPMPVRPQRGQPLQLTLHYINVAAEKAFSLTPRLVYVEGTNTTGLPLAASARLSLSKPLPLRFLLEEGADNATIGKPKRTCGIRSRACMEASGSSRWSQSFHVPWLIELCCLTHEIFIPYLTEEAYLLAG